jgi:crotonobetainyl-CoA:carnitine CoA-transferase CaiB-like acyl-CoA transferase
MMLPLDGDRVLGLAHLIAGPACGVHVADIDTDATSGDVPPLPAMGVVA